MEVNRITPKYEGAGFCSEITDHKESENYDNEMLYELAGFRKQASDEVGSRTEHEMNTLELVKTTLRRYHCSEVQAYKIVPLLHPEELAKMRPCTVLDLGKYPLFQNMHESRP